MRCRRPHNALRDPPREARVGSALGGRPTNCRRLRRRSPLGPSRGLRNPAVACEPASPCRPCHTPRFRLPLGSSCARPTVPGQIMLLVHSIRCPAPGVQPGRSDGLRVLDTARNRALPAQLRVWAWTAYGASTAMEISDVGDNVEAECDVGVCRAAALTPRWAKERRGATFVGRHVLRRFRELRPATKWTAEVEVAKGPTATHLVERSLPAHRQRGGRRLRRKSLPRGLDGPLLLSSPLSAGR